MTPILRNAQSVADLLHAASEVAGLWNPSRTAPQEIWFRGQPKASYSLLPGLYRPDNARYHYDEQTLFERFKARSAPFVDTHIRDEWDWYFLAQHHGLPTRLLDWTESLMAAAYFALSPHIECHDRLHIDSMRMQPVASPIYDGDSPAIWVLEATTLNQFTSGEDDECLISPGGELTAKFLPSEILNHSPANRYPLAILPPQTNRRIAAQQGMFTIHGHDNHSIDDLASTAESRIELARITIDRANLAHFWDNLETMGVHRLTLFPDCDAAAYYAKWFSQIA